MSQIAIASPNGQVTPADQMAKPIRDRIKQGREWRKQFEQTWQLSMALAAGKHWQNYDRMTRTLRGIKDTDPRYKGRELYSADMVTEYRTTMLGELGSDNDRPQLLLQRDDQQSEDFESQANRAVAYGWDFEWDGDNILAQIDRLVIDLGTSAVRCRYDASQGAVKADNVPYQGGRPVLDMEEATQLLGGGPNPDVQMGEIREGRIQWEPLSSFNLIVPPGVPHESKFPWECTVVPTLVAAVKDEYGELAAEIQEDSDIGSVLGTETKGAATDPVAWAGGDGRNSRLRDHVWLFTYFEKQTSRYPQGRVAVFCGNDLKLLDYRDGSDGRPALPYKAPDGTWRSGIAYFHWWRVTGRFWSRSLVEAMMDGQRLLDKRRTQLNEIIDRSMPKTYVERGSKAMDETGVPGEFIEIGKSERQPLPSQGIQPGAWMQQDVEAIREDIEHATGIKGPRLGENPSQVTTYSQLALINESEQVKRDQIHRERRLGIAKLVEDSVYDIRTYWGPEKQIMLAGDDGRMEAEAFNATQIPTFYVVSVATGSAKPRSQAAKLKMVEDIWAAAINSGAVQTNPAAWVAWFKESLEAGEPRDLPETDQSDHQTDKAELENHMMMQGELAPVAYYDRIDIHIPIHRFVQDQAMIAGEEQLWQLVEQHVQLHLQAAQQNAAALPPAPPGQLGPPEPGAAPPGPPAGPPQ